MFLWQQSRFDNTCSEGVNIIWMEQTHTNGMRATIVLLTYLDTEVISWWKQAKSPEIT
jgi:hypothetical protein